jgi:two-component system LytT family sensor kinase
MMSDPAYRPARLDWRLVLASIVGLWLCYFALVTLRSWLLGWEDGWELFWRRGVVTGAGMVLTLVLWWALHWFDRSATWVKIVAALILALPISVLSAQVNYTVFSGLHDHKAHEDKVVVVKVQREHGDDVLRDLPDLPPGSSVESTRIVIGEPVEDKPPPTMIPVPVLGQFELASWEYVTDMTFGRYFMLLSWCALYLAMLAGERAKVAERRAGEYRQAAKTAELRSLRYQVNPHFLFNTLNSLSALVMTGRPERAEDMIQTLSTYYRRTLSGDPTADVTLADEVALQQLYLEIEAVRFPDRLRTRVEISPTVASALVPGMILQPIVENSVKYAIAARHEPVTIGIHGEAVGGNLVVTVSDDGPMTETGDPHGCGIGLGNVRDRLRARFGDAASLAFGPCAEGGFETVLTMPLRRSRA